MVEELWRYLLKSALGESLLELAFDADGPRFDRSWACLDGDGLVVSAKQPRRWGRLLSVSARLAEDDSVTVSVPGGLPATAGTPAATEELSRWLGEPVSLSRVVPANARLSKRYPREPGLRPSWAEKDPEDKIGKIIGAVPGGRFVDYGAVHVITLADLEQLRRDGAPDTDTRRFRPNLVLSLDRQPRSGDRVQLDGGVELAVTVPTPRCAVPGAAQLGVPAEPAVLRAVGRRRTVIPGIGTAACVGVYANVIRPGLVRRGERARLVA